MDDRVYRLYGPAADEIMLLKEQTKRIGPANQ